MLQQESSANAPEATFRPGGVIQQPTNLIVVDCGAPKGVGAPSVGDMTEFGAAEFIKEPPFVGRTFHGTDHSRQTFESFAGWLADMKKRPPVFWSDNPAYDWQWINFYFWQHLGHNPFGHSARRIGDFYAGLTGDLRNTQRWKRLRITKHDHHSVHDAIGNCEALGRLLKGERP